MKCVVLCLWKTLNAYYSRCLVIEIRAFPEKSRLYFPQLHVIDYKIARETLLTTN